MRYVLYLFAGIMIVVVASDGIAQIKARPETKPEPGAKDLRRPATGAEPSKPPSSEGVKEVPEKRSRKPPGRVEGQRVTPPFQIKKGISAQASRKGIVLTEEAQDSLTRLVSQEERYLVKKGGSAALAIQPAEEAVEHLRATGVTGQVDRRAVESAVLEKKIQRVKKVSEENIDLKAREVGSNPSAKARLLISETVQSRTENMARSGVPTEEMIDLNRRCLDAFFSKAGSGPLDERKVAAINKGLFRRIISLRIDSEPDGAFVELAGLGNIGKTKIERRALETEKEYTFVIQKQGYKTATRSYIPVSCPEEQELREILIDESK